ncbi:MAG: D-aminoacyl-tRNA deacylase [Haloarculaceae archaeon]
MLAIVVSRADRASEHICEHLLELEAWRESEDGRRPDAEGGGTVYRTDGAELRTFDAIHLELERVGEAFDDPDLLAFASRHAGETGPLLTTHHTGNFGPAEFGGADGRLARACPNAHREVIAALREYAPEGYDVGMECTHHGPSEVGVPSLFVEVGSGEQEWDDPEAARAVARAILDLRDVPADASRENDTRRHLVGFGGGHYAPRFERVLGETDWRVGHVAADWCLDAMGDPGENRAVLERAFTESAADIALLEDDRPDLRETVESMGYRVVGETFVHETSGVPLGLVERVEDEICPVADGLRFGKRARGYNGEFAVRSLPSALLAEANGIDPEATREEIAARTVAFDTDHGGTQVAERVAVREPDDRAEIIEVLADVLRRSYDSVEIGAAEIVARETAFDPELASERGVPEGPKFGRLAAGDPVEVDGDVIDPAEVRTERERRFER